MECPCGYIGDDFAKRDVNESDAVFSCGEAEIWICPECGKEIAETKELDDDEEVGEPVYDEPNEAAGFRRARTG